MFRNTYDSDNTTFSPQGRLHQVEYACEAVKQGSAVVGLRSKTHAVLVALKRAPSELAAHQNKTLKIDNHMGIGYAGLTSDARVLSHYMRQLALSSRLVYNRPLPLARIVGSLADRAQLNTMHYGKRPYGIGFLIIGVDATGPHLYEFSPTGNCWEYYAMALGARSQSSKTYLERGLEELPDLSKDELVLKGLYALRESLQQGKDLKKESVSIAVVGPNAHVLASKLPPGQAERFEVIDGDDVQEWLDRYVLVPLLLAPLLRLRACSFLDTDQRLLAACLRARRLQSAQQPCRATRHHQRRPRAMRRPRPMRMCRCATNKVPRMCARQIHSYHSLDALTIVPQAEGLRCSGCLGPGLDSRLCALGSGL